MKIAYLILAHKNPYQLKRLISVLNSKESCFIIHIDKKSNADEFHAVLSTISNCVIYYTGKRVRVKYPNFPILKAIINSIEYIFNNEIDFDYLINISGQDYPLKSKGKISYELHKNYPSSFMDYHEVRDPEKNGWGSYRYSQHYFVHSDWKIVKLWQRILNKTLGRRQIPDGLTPFGGSALWCLHYDAIKYMREYIMQRPQILKFFKTVAMPDEMFIHTILVNSHLRNNIINFGITYSEWPGNSTHSRTMTILDIDKLFASPKWFARKFDLNVDVSILDVLDKELHI